MYLFGSIIGARSATRALSLLVVGWRSHPIALGFVVGSPSPTEITPNRLLHGFPGFGFSLSLQQRTRTEDVCDGYTARRKVRRLRRGQPGFSGRADGSKKPITRCKGSQGWPIRQEARITFSGATPAKNSSYCSIDPTSVMPPISFTRKNDRVDLRSES